MYDCVSPINLPPQYPPRIRKLGFSTSIQRPKYVKCNVNDSEWSPISINTTGDLGYPEKEKIREFGVRRDKKDWKDDLGMEEPAARGGIDESVEDTSMDEVFKYRAAKKDYKLVKEDGIDSETEGFERDNNLRTIDAAKSRKQMMRRSNAMAKQVISIRSALSLGFVSQLWVDTSSWVVVVVEVKPSLLSGDSERFLLKEITQVGDVILVQDETVMEDDLKLVGLETLVGYTVITPKRRSIGKVRGYTFNINSGMVESLELDSFGISLIPSSLVSTYALLVDDVVEVFTDTVVVRDAAVSRLQRLTKGFWDGQSAGNSNKEFQEQSDEEYADDSGRPRKSRKSRRNKRKSVDEWELPMDYL